MGAIIPASNSTLTACRAREGEKKNTEGEKKKKTKKKKKKTHTAQYFPCAAAKEEIASICYVQSLVSAQRAGKRREPVSQVGRRGCWQHPRAGGRSPHTHAGHGTGWWQEGAAG